MDINQMAKIALNKNLSIFKAISVAGLMLCASSSLAYAATCNTSWTATGGSQCTVTPDALTVSVYKFGLCQTKPTYDDYGDCLFFVNSDTATDVTVSQGTSFNLGSDMTLEAGTYTYLVQLWDDTVSFNFTQEFTTPQYGADGVVGSHCYTNGNAPATVPNTATLRNMSCTTSAALAAAAESTSNQQIVSVGGSNTATGFASVSGTFDVNLLSDISTLATVTTNTVTDGSGSTTYETSNGNYLFTVMTLSTPVTISADTTYIDMAVLLTDAVELQTYYTIGSSYIAGTWCNGGIADGNGTYACLGNSELSTLGFQFTND